MHSLNCPHPATTSVLTLIPVRSLVVSHRIRLKRWVLTFRLGLGDLACPLPTSLLAQVRGGRGSWREIRVAGKLVLSQVDFLPDHGGGKVGR